MIRWRPFWAMAAVAVPLLLWVASGSTFFHDDCWFFATHVADPIGSLLEPHNEHPSVVTTLVYGGLNAIAGTSSYLPYLAVLMGFHVAAASAVYAALLRHGVVVASVGAGFLLLLGAGYENLVWAFQIGFMASVAAGAWALLLIERRRYGWAALLLGVSLAASGLGLPFTAAAAVLVAFRPQRGAAWLALPIIGYAVWFGAIGRSTVHDPAWTEVPAYVVRTTIQLVGVVGGIPYEVAGFLVLAVHIAAVVAVWRGWRPSGLTVAGVVGFVAMFAVIGLVRVQYGGLSSRYVQPAYVLLVLALAGLPLRLPRLALGPVAAVVIAVALVNVGMLVSGAQAFASDDRRCSPTGDLARESAYPVHANSIMPLSVTVSPLAQVTGALFVRFRGFVPSATLIS